MSGTEPKTRAKYPRFNNFCVPLNAWDKLGTRLGQAIQRDTESFFKNREKTMKIERKCLILTYLHFSRGREKEVKNVSGSEPPTGVPAAASASGVAMSAGGQFLNIRRQILS